MNLFENIYYEVIGKPLLTEDKTSDYIKRLISQNVSEVFKPYLKTLVSELPENFQEHFKNAAEHSYDVCIEKNLNLTQLFRLEFLNFFGIGRQKGASEYTMGIARIAIEQLGMFTDESNHGKLSKLKQMVTFIANEPNELPMKFDTDLNGLTYKKLEETVYPYYKDWIERNKTEMSDVEEKSDYKIVPISSFEQASQYGDYTTWCVTQEKAHFDSYTTRGERFYFCLKPGFENVRRERTDGCPLDEYGLSMVSVLVDMDGEPVHITTRWNHENSGEDNPSLRTPKQVQEVIGVNFYETFKPFTEKELEELRANGDYQEDEETRMENYWQERNEHGVYLWNGCEILPEYDEDYNFNEDCYYYVYNTSQDDTSPITWDECLPEPVYVNERERIAILKHLNGMRFQIVVEYTSSRTEIDVISDIIKYEKYEVDGGDLIVFVQEDGAFCKIGYVCSGDYEINNKITFEDISNFFINKQIKEYGDLAEYEIPVEVVDGDGYRHSLFLITMNGSYISIVIKSDVPEDSIMFTIDNQGLIKGTLGVYSINGDTNVEEYVPERILSIEKNLDNVHYLVAVDTDDKHNCFNIITKGSKTKLVPFNFASYKFINNDFVKDCIVVRKFINDDFPFNNASFIFSYKENKIITNQHCDFASFDGILLGGDTTDGKKIVYSVINKYNFFKEFGPIKKFDTDTIVDNKIILVDTNSQVLIFDLEKFEVVQRFSGYAKPSKVLYDFRKQPYVAFRNIEDNITNLYYYPTMQILETDIIGFDMYRNVIKVKKENETFSVIDANNIEKILEGATFFDVLTGNYGVVCLKNDFVYVICTENAEFYPTKYGIDVRGTEQRFIDRSWIRFTFKYKNVDIDVKYSPFSNDYGSTDKIGSAQVNLDGSYNGWTSLKNCSGEIQQVVNSRLYPKEKQQFVSQYTEMLRRMKNLIK